MSPLLWAAVPLYVVLMVVVIAVHHRLVSRPVPARWWKRIDGPPSNVRKLHRR